MSSDSEHEPRDVGWEHARPTEVRRVVTGIDEAGHSKVIFDGLATQYAQDTRYDGVAATVLWRAEAGMNRADLADGAVAMRRLPAGGTQFYVVTIAPRTRVPFHTTNTYEYHCVVAGEIVCLLEVDEVTVRAGEVLIVRGSPHAWENRTDTPWMSVVSMMSAAPTA